MKFVLLKGINWQLFLFPGFGVFILSEAGNTMTTVERDDVTLVYAQIIPNEESPDDIRYGEDVVLQPDESNENEPGHVSFRSVWIQ